jgi:hypothetical protein
MVLWLLIACKTAQIEVVDRHEGFELGNYESFRFIENDGDAFSMEYRPKVNFLKDEIVRQMEARDVVYDADSKDLLVNIGLAVYDRHSLDSPDSFIFIGKRRYDWDREKIKLGRYPQGTMIIHLVDPEKQEAVLIGTVEKVLPRGAGHLHEAVIRGVERLFREIEKD